MTILNIKTQHASTTDYKYTFQWQLFSPPVEQGKH